MKKTRRIEAIFEIIRIVAAMAVAYIVALIILFLISDDPGYAIGQFVFGPFSTLRRFGDVVSLATPFIFTGLCMCFMYAVNKFNLVGEGVFLFSGCMASWFAISMADSNMSGPVMMLIMILIGAVCGGAIAAIPALLDARFKANVVVISLMMNYMLNFLVQHILKYNIKDSTIAYTGSVELPTRSSLPNLIPKTTVHFGLIIALVCTLLVCLLFYKTTFGYGLRTVGSSPSFAKYAGIGIMSTTVMAQVVGGVFAGMGGAVEIMGMYRRFQWVNLTQHGFDGLIVAVLAKRNPALVPLTAFLLAYIRIGADIVNRTTDIPAEFVTIIQGIIILLVAAELFLSSFKNKLIFKNAKESLAKAETAKQ
ncbi:MAG: ABC transporter permease [Oscillospiraceae bacterium]